MTKLFIHYSLAMLAKKKGFNEPCFAYYGAGTQTLCWLKIGGDTLTNSMQEECATIPCTCSAPLYQQIIDWFDSKGLYISVTHQSIQSFSEIWECKIEKRDQQEKRGLKILFASQYHNNRLEALDEAIVEAFKLI